MMKLFMWSFNEEEINFNRTMAFLNLIILGGYGLCAINLPVFKRFFLNLRNEFGAYCRCVSGFLMVMKLS